MTPTATIRGRTPSSPTPAAIQDTLASIAAFRVNGDRGFALYHGKNGKNYAVPLEKEGGKWKVGSVSTTAI